MSKTNFFIWILVFTLINLSYATEVHRARTPQISPDGKTIAFACWGDIWVVSINGGTAKRLTDHIADDFMPVWSPDGTKIAFGSDRNGNSDIFVMPSSGGTPVQLTFHSTYDYPTSWSSATNKILFNSGYREDRLRNIYAIGEGDVMPTRLTIAGGKYGKLSPDGKNLLYIRNGLGGTNRKGYRGSTNSEIWLMDQNRNHTKLTDFNGNDEKPLWAPNGKEFYFISDRFEQRNALFRGVREHIC